MYKHERIINLSYVKVNRVGSLCNLTYGKTSIYSHHTSFKSSQGFGQESSDFSNHFKPKSTVNDADFIDSYSSS